MSIKTDRDRLLQLKTLARLKRVPPATELLTVYLSRCDGPSVQAISCALIPSDRIEHVLSNTAWDLDSKGGLPGSETYSEGGEERSVYLRYGNDDGFEPLVIWRDFAGLRDDYLEISEEFRLFHNLYRDLKSEKYYTFDEAGREHLIAVVTADRVQIRLKEIRQFIAVKEMYLSIQFECSEGSTHSLADLGIEGGGSDHHEPLLCWSLHYDDSSGIDEYQTFSHLLGKQLISPISKAKSGFPGFAEPTEEKDVDFVIGLDENGEEVTVASSPAQPGFLTLVCFSKKVLDKYYLEPSKYSVEDSIVRCASLWHLSIDNHHDDRVCAWLGDLRRNLPYEEQLHWRTHNIPPSGGMSETYLRRQLLAEFTESERPEHLFRRRYNELAEVCKVCLGWQVLLPLSADDQHHLQGMRIPATDEQREFDELVLGLTKILIDSLNEKHLNRFIPAAQSAELKGSIARLEVALDVCGVQDASEHISFLRKLQSLRSSSAAHRKGSNYQKMAAEFGFESRGLREVFSGLLRKAIDVLDFFVLVVHGGQLEKSTQANG